MSLLSARHVVGPVALLLLASSLAGCDTGPPPLTFAPDALPDAHVGQPYDQRIEIGQNRTPLGGITAGDGSLPPGLSIEKVAGTNNAGHIVGTPTAAGTATFTVSVWCYGTNVNGQAGSKRYTLTVR